MSIPSTNTLEISPFLSAIEPLEELATQISTMTPDDVGAAHAIRLYTEAKNMLDELDEAKKQALEPFRAAIDMICTAANGVKGRLQAIEQTAKDLVEAYHKDRVEKERIAQQTIAHLKESLGIELEIKTPIHSLPANEKAQAMTRDRWAFTVTDESALPRKYLSPDLKKIRMAVSAGIRQIDGVEIGVDSSIIIRRKQV